MGEVGTACTLYQFVMGHPWPWNTIISEQMLAPLISSDNTPHSFHNGGCESRSVTVYSQAMEIHGNLNTQFKYCSEQLTSRKQELKLEIINTKPSFKQKRNNFSSTNMYTSDPHGTCYHYLLLTGHTQSSIKEFVSPQFLRVAKSTRILSLRS